MLPGNNTSGSIVPNKSMGFWLNQMPKIKSVVHKQAQYIFMFYSITLNPSVIPYLCFLKLLLKKMVANK